MSAARQGAMEMLAQGFPGAFEGYTLTVTEAHQSSKARPAAGAPGGAEPRRRQRCSSREPEAD